MQTNQPLKDEDVLIGGPMGASIDVGVEAPEKNLPETSTKTVETSGPVFIGSRQFGSQQEAESYLAMLEQETLASRQRVTQQSQQTQAEAPPELDLEKLFYEDPRATFKMIKEQTKQEVFAEYERIKAREQMWADFYDKNPDLRNFKELVSAQVSLHMSKLQNQPTDVGLPFIAKETRELLKKARGMPSGNGDELPSGPAKTAGSSGMDTPKAPTPGPVVLMSFSDQVRGLGKKKRK